MLKPLPERDMPKPPLEANILSTINNFLEKYDLDDIRLKSYTNETKRIIAEIINGKIGNYTNSKNYIILSYIAEYYRQIKKDNSSAEKYYLMTIKHNDSDSESMDNLASLYKEQLKLDLAEKYYLTAAEHNNSDAMVNLGNLYKKQNKSDLAEKYYLMAIEHDNSYAMDGLGNLYNGQDKLVLAEKYYLMAIKYDNPFAMYHLANLYNDKYESELAEKYYLLAVGHELSYAMYYLANLYKELNKLDLAEKYYRMAIEYGFSCAVDKLADLYKGQNKLELAIEYYQKALLIGNCTLLNIIDILPHVSKELQLEMLEVVPQIRQDNEYFMKIPNTVHHLYMEKKIELVRHLLYRLNYDIVSICLEYY